MRNFCAYVGHPRLFHNAAHTARPCTSSLLLAACIAGAAGCSTNQTHSLTASVGPPQFMPASGSQDGELVVYSALLIPLRSNAQFPVFHHSSYQILVSDGTRWKYIANCPSTFSGEPETVSLAPGSYQIEARTSSSGTITLAVTIEAGKTTSVYLDGSDLPDRNLVPRDELVSLPNGPVIGWRAEQDSTNQ